jgi:putative Mn2+ efflux pump MntP
VTFGAILVLAVGLAIDATAVAAARGVATASIRVRHVVLVAAYFGGFQALMPIVGYLVGSRIGPLVRAWDHWIAFGLLVAVGGKMVWSALGKRGAVDSTAREAAQPGDRGDLFAAPTMLALAVATSIDALAVGVTLPMLHAPLALSVATIWITAALMSAGGLLAGRRLGGLLGARLEVVGGLVLIGLGIEILWQHLR